MGEASTPASIVEIEPLMDGVDDPITLIPPFGSFDASTGGLAARGLGILPLEPTQTSSLPQGTFSIREEELFDLFGPVSPSSMGDSPLARQGAASEVAAENRFGEGEMGQPEKQEELKQLEEGEVDQPEQGEAKLLEESEENQLEEEELDQPEEGEVSEGEVDQPEKGQLDELKKEELDQLEENVKHGKHGKVIGSSSAPFLLDSLPSHTSSLPSQDPPLMLPTSPLPHSPLPCSVSGSSDTQSSYTSHLNCLSVGCEMDVGYAPPTYFLRSRQESRECSGQEPAESRQIKAKKKKPACLGPVTDGATGQQVKDLSPSGTPCSSASHSSSPSPLLAQLSPEFPKLCSLPAVREPKEKAIPPVQRELLPHVCCPLPLPVWLASALVRVQNEQTHHMWKKATRKRKYICSRVCPVTRGSK